MFEAEKHGGCGFHEHADDEYKEHDDQQNQVFVLREMQGTWGTVLLSPPFTG